MSEKVKKLIFAAAAAGQWGIVRVAIEKKGYTVNLRDEGGNTLLHFAAAVDSVKAIDYFIEKGIDVNVTNKSDSTALHMAAKYGRFQAVKHLVEKGADVNALNNNDNNPFHVASQYGHHEIAKYLKEAGAEAGAKAEEETESNKWVDKFRPRTDFKSLAKEKPDC